MKRRSFIKNSAVAGSLAALPILGSCGKTETAGAEPASPAGDKRQARKFDFKRYRESATLVPVHKVTPDDGYYLHTFYDICPWSPSQR